ncbi:hypothetical protein JOF53_005449 [Crossiella equi]|uniref:Uncharacterized protein n=1 Tax=Crossiella equi TaxID=130796 RepID=A0ABS5AJM1_9PSEU|nr:hypothetical protein [Crossiella equi]MBP2476577.1 hypothetical protein [Crossiella equi]
MTRQQAVEQLDAHLLAALKVLPEGAAYKKWYDDVVRCDLPSDSGPKGRVSAALDYEIQGLPMADFRVVFDKVVDYWTRNGYTVLADQRPSHWYVWVQSAPEEFRLALNGNDVGGLYLGGSSPCVWPKGTPS